MCGIVGMISRKKTGFWNVHLKIFEELLLCNQLRGAHGTGILYNNKKSSCLTLKQAARSSMFLQNEAWEKTAPNVLAESTYIIGHNRYATMGDKDTKSTHPFTEKYITLVHNGTISGHKSLSNVDVDSHAITIAIAEKGIEEVVKELNGAFTLVWHDNRNKTINFLRNKERPLYLVETDDAWYISSEYGLVSWILGRNGIKQNSSESIPIETLFVIDLATLEMIRKPIEYKPPYVYTGYKYEGAKSYNTYRPDWRDNKTNTTIISGNDKPHINQFKLKENVIFTPLQVKPINKDSYYLEGYAPIDAEGEEEVEVRFYSNNQAKLEGMKSHDLLQGTVCSHVYNPTTKYVYYVLENLTVYRDKRNKKKSLVLKEVKGTSVIKATGSQPALFRTGTGAYLSLAQIDALPNECTTCGGAFSHDVRLISCSEVVFEGDKTTCNCPDCMQWIYKMNGNSIL